MNHLYYIRHGENPANLTKELSHFSVDYPLTLKGVLQARQTAERLAGLGIDEVYTSPLRRAVETAQVIAARLGLPLTILENFREVNVGELELQPPTAATWGLHDRILESWFSGNKDLSFPAGENYYQLWTRVQSGLKWMFEGKTDRKVALVAHGGLLFCVLQDLCPDLDPSYRRSLSSHNCSVTEMDVAVREGKILCTLQAWAQYDHLHGEAADLVSGMPEADFFEAN